MDKYNPASSSGFSSISKPPKPGTAVVGTYKRLNMAMNAIGSSTTAHFMKKVPDH
jgi:hypothetical protein